MRYLGKREDGGRPFFNRQDAKSAKVRQGYYCLRSTPSAVYRLPSTVHYLPSTVVTFYALCDKLRVLSDEGGPGASGRLANDTGMAADIAALPWGVIRGACGTGGGVVSEHATAALFAQALPGA